MGENRSIRAKGTVVATPALRIVPRRTPADMQLVVEAGSTAKCSLCGLRVKTETARRHLSGDFAGVVTCHQLDCGHAWHRTVANVGGIFPGLVRNATFVPCDCVEAAQPPA